MRTANARQITSSLRLRAVLVPTLFVSCLAFAGCGGDDAAGDDGDAPADDPTTVLQAALERLGDLKNAPWLGTLLTVRQPLIDVHSRVFNALSGGAEDRDALLARLAELEPVLAKLEEIDPLASRVWQSERGCNNLFDQLAIPSDAVFPLRTRFQDGWLKDRGTHFSYLVMGLEAMLNGQNSDALAIAMGNLERLANEGEALFHELNGLTRGILVLDAKLENLETKAIPWGEKVLKTAKGNAKVSDDERQALRKAVDDATATLPTLQAAWKTLRLTTLSGEPEAQKRMTDLIRRTDVPLAEIRRVGNPIAVKLRMIDFKRGA